MAVALDGTEAPASATREAATEVNRYSRSGDMLKARMTSMVKGAGFVGNGNTPLTNETQIMTKAHQATLDLRTETYRGYADKASVVKGLNPSFLDQHGYLKTALSMPSINEQIQQALGAVIHIARALVAVKLHRIQAQTRGERNNNARLPVHENAHRGDEGRQLAPHLPCIGRRNRARALLVEIKAQGICAKFGGKSGVLGIGDAAYFDPDHEV